QRPLYNCKTLVDIDIYFERLKKSYESIKFEGFKTQGELKADQGLFTKMNDELFVLLDSNGEIIFGGGGGNHRLMISKLLHIEKIPFKVLGIHEDYINKSAKKYKSNNIYTIIKKILNDKN